MDAMWGSPIKEMGTVQSFMAIHPSTAMLTDMELKLSPVVNIGVQAVVNVNAWLMQGRQ
jgi:hypothetical protein